MDKRPILKNITSKYYVLNKKDFLLILINNYSAFRSLFNFSYIYCLNKKKDF